MSQTRSLTPPPIPSTTTTTTTTTPITTTTNNNNNNNNNIIINNKNNNRYDSLILTPQASPLGGPDEEELDTIWENAADSPSVCYEMDPSMNQYQLEQILVRLLDQKEKLVDELTETKDHLKQCQADISSTSSERDTLMNALVSLNIAIPEEALQHAKLGNTPTSSIKELPEQARKLYEDMMLVNAELKLVRDLLSERDDEIRELLSERDNTRILLGHLERLVARHEKSLRNTVVKRQTNTNGVSSEIEVLRALQCLFDHHKNLDKVKEKLKTQISRTRDLEDLLSCAKREGSLLRRNSKIKCATCQDNGITLEEALENQAIIEDLKFQLEENAAEIDEKNSRIMNLETELDELKEKEDTFEDQCNAQTKKMKDLLTVLTSKERSLDKLDKSLQKAQQDLADLTQNANQNVRELQSSLTEKEIIIKQLKREMESVQSMDKRLSSLRENDKTRDHHNTNQSNNREIENLQAQQELLLEEKLNLIKYLDEKDFKLQEMKSCNESLIKKLEVLKVSRENTIEKLAIAEKERMEFEQLLKETLPVAKVRNSTTRKSRREQIRRVSMTSALNKFNSDMLIMASATTTNHRPASEMLIMASATTTNHRPASDKRPASSDANTTETKSSPENTPTNSRKESPENTESPDQCTSNENLLNSLELNSSATSLTDICDTITTNSMELENTIPRSEFNPGMPYNKNKSSKAKVSRKSSIKKFLRPRSMVDIMPPVPPSTTQLTSVECADRRARQEAIMVKVEKDNTEFLLWTPEIVQAWVEIELSLPEVLGNTIKRKCLAAIALTNYSERDYESELEMHISLHRMKLMRAVHERVALGKKRLAPCLYSPFRQVTNEWITGYWLPSLGLSQYINNFRQSSVDGRMLEHLTKKELRTSLGMIETPHKNSLLYGTAILNQLNYCVAALEEKHRLPISQFHELAYWSNRQFGEWLVSIGLEAYTFNLECKAIHGAVLFYDSDFDYNEMALSLQIPRSDVAARKKLKQAHQNLIRVIKSSADKKAKRKSFGLFPRKKNYSNHNNQFSTSNNNFYSPPTSPDLCYHPHSTNNGDSQDTNQSTDSSDRSNFIITPISHSSEDLASMDS